MGLDRRAVASAIGLVSEGDDAAERTVPLDALLDKAFLGAVACLRRKLLGGGQGLTREETEHLFTYLDAESTGGVTPERPSV